MDVDQARLEERLNQILLNMAKLQKIIQDNLDDLKGKGELSSEFEALAQSVMKDVDYWTDQCTKPSQSPPVLLRRMETHQERLLRIQTLIEEKTSCESEHVERLYDRKKRDGRISTSSMFLWDQTPQEMAFTLKGAGIKELEFWAETPWYWEQNCRPDLIDVIKKELAGFRINVHAPIMDLNPSSYNDQVHKITINESLKSIDLAKALGAEVMTIHPGKRSAKRPIRDEERNKFQRYLEACLDRALDNKVLLALENLEPSVRNMCTEPKEMEILLDEYSIGMTLDISHAVPPLSLALSFVELLADSILNVHVSTTIGPIRHLPPSDGSVDEVLIALHDAGYKGPLTLELDDNKFPMPMSKKEKIKVLKLERLHLDSVWGL